MNIPSRFWPCLLVLCSVLPAVPAWAQGFTPVTPTSEQLARCDALAERLRDSCRETFAIPSLTLPKAP